MKIPFVDLRLQYEGIKEEINLAISSVLEDTAFIGGKYVKQFEESFAGYIKANHCIGVGNGTDALFVAMRALGIGEGDEVITVANSFIATSEAITMAGARVVFVDCDPLAYTIDVQKVCSAISPRTKAIVPVHLYGQPANMPELLRIAKQHGLFVIEDAAQAHGAEIGGRRIGTFGDVGCFSFYPGKNLGAYGDAGAIVTNDAEVAARCRMLANHGRIDKYDHKFEGVNSRLDGMQAAVLNVKLKYLDGWIEKRRWAASMYKELLATANLDIAHEVEGMRHVFHLYVVRVKGRDAIQAALKDAGIATGIHYPIALPELQAYGYLGHSNGEFPVATRYSREILSLPMYAELTPVQIEYVCDNLKKLLK